MLEIVVYKKGIFQINVENRIIVSVYINLLLMYTFIFYIITHREIKFYLDMLFSGSAFQ